MAILYGALGLLVVPFILLASLMDPAAGSPLFALLFPLIYAGGGYVMTALGAVAYNTIAARFGGIEITLGPSAESTGSY